MAKIKELFTGDNLKRMALKHGEKVVLGLVALFVLLTLTGTNWVNYTKRPGALLENLQQADVRIENSTWPEEEQGKYPGLNTQDDVNQMLAELTDQQFAFSTDYVGSPFGTDEPRREVELLTVMQLRATSGRTLLAQQKEMPKSRGAGGEELAATDEFGQPIPQEKPEDDDAPDDVARRPAGVMARMDGMDGAEGMANPYGRSVYEEEVMVNYDPNAMIMEDAMMMEEGGGMGMGLPSNIKGVPVRYISIRGVYDLRKQVVNYSKALNVSEVDAARLVEFLDFKLERQMAETPQGPWGEWEPVDIEVAIDYLKQTVDFDSDVVSVGVRNPAITMPLPARLLGVWRNAVNHPAVKNFELTEAEIEMEAALNRQILEQARKNQRAIKQRTAPGGFARLQLDAGTMQRDFFEQTDERQITRAMEDEFKGTPAEVKKKLIERIRAQVTAAGNLVLFRYIDFDLLPGKSYRYRVSLVLRNPNYDQPVERVVHPSVVEGETRDTPVSEPSNVASVAPDYAYFLTRVNPPRGVANEQAEMQIFQWYDQTGTMIKGNLAMEPGDFISGKTKTYVLDPASLKYEEEPDVPFQTNDLLVDALFIPKLDARLHGGDDGLRFPRNLTRGEVGVVPQALVVNIEGKLQEIDPVSGRATQKSYEDYYVAEKKPFDDIKDRGKKGPASDLDMLLGEEGMTEEMMMEGMEGARRLRGRRRNATRRADMMDEAYMMEGPGGAAPAGRR